ncbi:MAG: phosphoesterase [Deltaproteobacteria bacterium CG07_land_8_20_14_0_80_60_11]|nr:MAG: phosphoesterase [Deltaproteobacteria bacterium CG07_land_8_20_14_0_80_60_11]
MKELIDLHVHSSASDGSYSPAEVVRLAKEGGLTAMALTDHDTVDGLPEAVAAGARLGLEVIPGVEISAQFPGGTMHILGLFVDYTNGRLDERLAVLKQARIDRNPQIINKLNALGIPITMARVEEISGGGQVGRPHIARALMESGYIRDLQEAFDKYLGWRKPAYVSKFRFPPDQALTMIREAKGIPVLAHPFTLNLGSAYALKNLVVELKGQGLAGLEVFYSEHTPEQIALYLKLTQELDLLVTGGSDYHGLNKPEISLGSMPCQDRLTYHLVTALKAWRRREYPPGG